MDLLSKLIEKGFLDKERAASMEAEAEDSGKSREEVLLKEDIISEEELFDVKSEATGFPLRKDVDPDQIEEEAFSLIQKDSAGYYKMVPLKKDENKMEVGMVYPEDLRAREALKFISRKENLSCEIYLIPFSVFEAISRRYDGEKKEKLSALLEELTKREFLKEEEARSIEEEAKSKKKKIEEILLEKEIISEEELFDVKSEVVEVPLKKDIKTEEIPRDLASLINEDAVNYYKMIPLGKEGDTVEVGMVYPESLRAQEALKFISRKNIFAYKTYLITLSDFEKARQKAQPKETRLGTTLMEKLVEKSFLQEEQAQNLEKEAEKRGVTKEKILLEEKIVSEEDLFSVKSEITGTPFRRGINLEEVPEEVFNLFSKEVVVHYKMVPIGKEGDAVEVGMVYPEDDRAKDVLKITAEKQGFSYKPYLISFSDFREISKKYRSAKKEFESPLVEELVKREFLPKEEAQKLEEEVGRSEKTREELLLEREVISEEDLFNIKSEVFGFPFRSDFSLDNVDDDLLRLIPEDSANYYKMAPIGKEGDTVEVGMVYPESLRAQEALKFLSRREGFSHSISLISISAFDAISKQYRTLSKEVGAALEDLDEMDFEEGEEESLDVEEDIGRLAEEAPIVKVVGVILRNAIEGGASDIHIEPTRDKLKIRFRVDGVLYSSLYLPGSVHLATIARVKILAGIKIDEQRLPQDGRFSTKIKEKNVDFRVATFPTTLGEKAVIRVLDPTEGIKTVEELGVTERNFQILRKSIKKPTGLTLVTGPTGSGKTTTLYSLMKLLNEEKVNIVTLEDPVEYYMDGINQSQVNPEIGYVFSKGLRQILRQDPDVIMVGEIRDDETADLATHAALTGHVVLSTLHTNDATGVIPRLIDMGIKPFLIPSSLNLAMAQRLVRKLCDKCRKEVTPSEDMRLLIEEELDKLPEVVREDIDIPSPIKLYKTEGCKQCSEEGYEGRMGIFEVLSMTQELGEIIMGNPTTRQIQEEAHRQGMITLKQDGFIKATQGYTTIEEVLRATEET